MFCQYCNIEIKNKRFGAKYCSSKCRVYASRRRIDRNKKDNLSFKPLWYSIIDIEHKLNAMQLDLTPEQKRYLKAIHKANIDLL